MHNGDLPAVFAADELEGEQNEAALENGGVFEIR
jgi:hypothetical protein